VLNRRRGEETDEQMKRVLKEREKEMYGLSVTLFILNSLFLFCSSVSSVVVVELPLLLLLFGVVSPWFSCFLFPVFPFFGFLSVL